MDITWVAIAAWGLVTVASIAMMYRLWWERERALYLGKEVQTQREEVFRRAGIPRSVLFAYEKIESKWPLGSYYRHSGDHNLLSYLKYLLIPRIPSEESSYWIEAKGDQLEFHGKPTSVDVKRNYPDSPRLQGLFFSLACILGVGILVGTLLRGSQASIPELVAVSSFLLMACAILSVFWNGNPRKGFLLFSIAGSLGWPVRLSVAVLNFRKGHFRAWWNGSAIQNFLKFLDSGFCRNDGRGIVRRLEAITVHISPALLGLVLVSVFIWSMAMSVVVVPDDWDAWAIWGAKAKVMALGHGPLEDVTRFGHPDYPLLWPAVWAFSGWLAGGWEEHWSRGWGPIFMLLAAWQICTILKENGGTHEKALLAAAVFLSVPMVPLIASWSYAEAPLWLMITCCFGAMIRWRTGQKGSHLLAAAVFAAAAAYTKNEGILFACLCFLWLLASNCRRWKDAVFLFAVPFAALYAPWFYWTKVVLNLGSDALAGMSWDANMVSLMLGRLPEALVAIGRMWIDIRQWNIVLFFLAAAVLWDLFKGDRFRKIDMMLPIGLLIGYLLVNLGYYGHTAQQFGASWNRLTVQAIPLFIISAMNRKQIINRWSDS